MSKGRKNPWHRYHISTIHTPIILLAYSAYKTSYITYVTQINIQDDPSAKKKSNVVFCTKCKRQIPFAWSSEVWSSWFKKLRPSHHVRANTHTKRNATDIHVSVYQYPPLRVIIRIITQISYTQNVGHLHTLPSTETKYESQPWSLPAISEAPYSEVCCLGFGEMKGYYKCNILYTKVKGHRNSTKIWILICIYIYI